MINFYFVFVSAVNEHEGPKENYNSQRTLSEKQTLHLKHTLLSFLTEILEIMYNSKQNVESHSFSRASTVHLAAMPPTAEVYRSVADLRAL